MAETAKMSGSFFAISPSMVGEGLEKPLYNLIASLLHLWSTHDVNLMGWADSPILEN